LIEYVENKSKNLKLLFENIRKDVVLNKFMISRLRMVITYCPFESTCSRSCGVPG
jgi:hypothetical protein